MRLELTKEILKAVKKQVEYIQVTYSEYVLTNSVGNVILEDVEMGEDSDLGILICFKDINLEFNNKWEIEAVPGEDYNLTLYEILSHAVKECPLSEDNQKIAKAVIEDLRGCIGQLKDEFFLTNP